MIDGASIIVANGWPVIAALYWVCLIVGGGMLLMSTVLAHHTDGGIDVHTHADLPGDVHTDPSSHHGHAHSGSLASWFSTQFIVVSLATFGFVGVVLRGLSEASEATTLAASLIGGLVLGQGAHQLLRYVRRSSGDSTPRREDYIDRAARVTIAIAPPKHGEIALQVRGTERFVPAVSKREDRGFRVGESVRVTDYEAGVATVVSKEEHEFVTAPK